MFNPNLLMKKRNQQIQTLELHIQQMAWMLQKYPCHRKKINKKKRGQRNCYRSKETEDLTNTYDEQSLIGPD